MTIEKIFEKSGREYLAFDFGDGVEMLNIEQVKQRLDESISVKLPLKSTNWNTIIDIYKTIDRLADEYSNEQKLAYIGNDQKTIRENDIKINTLMELKRELNKE